MLPVRVNSAVSLRYQIAAPPPITRMNDSRTNSMPKQDFMSGFASDFAPPHPAVKSCDCAAPAELLACPREPTGRCLD